MTANQINFAKHGETQRHNYVSEKQKEHELAIGQMSAQAAQRQAEVAADRLSEERRHNKESEQINWFAQNWQREETSRHNLQGEQATWFNAQTERDYKITSAESLRRQAAVSERLAAVSERQATAAEENAISQRMQAVASQWGAQASQQQALASLQQAKVAAKNARTRESELAESLRHNSTVEYENWRHNIAQESNAQGQLRNETKRVSIERQNADSREVQAQASATQAAASRKNAAVNAVTSISSISSPMERATSFITPFAKYIMGGLS